MSLNKQQTYKHNPFRHNFDFLRFKAPGSRQPNSIVVRKLYNFHPLGFNRG